MEVILTGDLKGTGEKGERKNVKPGFARNYLLPSGLAILPEDPSARKLELDFSKREEAGEAAKASEDIAEAIQNLNLEFVLKSEKGKGTYTGITGKKIAEELMKKYQIHAEKVDQKGALKEVGEYNVKFSVGVKEFEVLIKIISK